MKHHRNRLPTTVSGLAALVAPHVSNRGTINAKLGRVMLGGAETHALDMYGDGLLERIPLAVHSQASGGR